MEFLKKNYEKVLLGVVLAGLAVVVVFLFLWISNEKQKLGERTQTIIKRSAKPLPPLNAEYYDELLSGLKSPPTLDLSMTNRLFNPVKWQKATDGRLIKITRGDEVGPRAVVVTNITPLYTTITLETVTPGESSTRYRMLVEREAAPPALRRRPYFVSYPFVAGNNKNDFFVVTAVKGLPEDPVLELTLVDSGDKVEVSKATPYQRPDAYMADLKYDPEKRTFKNCRVGGPPIAFAGEEYNVVAISETEVVISAKSNNKKTTIKYAGAP